MNKKIIISVIFVILVAGTSLSGCKQEETIKIGVLGTLTGVGSFAGQEQIRGLELAVNEINLAGGIKGKQIELVVEDTQTAPASAVSAVKKLIEIDQVKFIVGDSWSSTTIAVVPITNAANVLVVSPVAILDELAKDDLFFRTVPTTKDMMDELANFAFNEMGVRKVAVLRQDTSFGVEHTEDFKIAFEELGGEIVAEEKFPLTQTDLRTEIFKVIEEEPDTIFNLHATGAMIGVLMKQAKELGVDVKWIGSFGSENAPLLREYGDVVEGLVYPFIFEEEEKFAKLYEETFYGAPNFIAANAYDALKVLAQAIDEVGEDPVKVKEQLLTVKNFEGGSGTFSFDKNGDVAKTVFIKEIKDGEFVKLS